MASGDAPASPGNPAPDGTAPERDSATSAAPGNPTSGSAVGFAVGDPAPSAASAIANSPDGFAQQLAAKLPGKLGQLIMLLLDRMGGLLHEATKFGVIGLAALVVDVGLFNLLLFGFGGDGPLDGKPLTAKVVSVAVATTFAYFGNRFWTFRHRETTGFAREYILFLVLNVIGMGIALSCLWISHYAFGFTSPLADNISANVIGLILGTLFRFWSYRKWVFQKAPAEEALAFAEV